MTQDITGLSASQKEEIANYIARDNLVIVNRKVKEVKVKSTLYTRYIKRGMDMLISLVALVVFAPLNLIIAIVTFFDVGAPIIFKQQRIGINERKFTIYKFRNMTNETDAKGELLPARERITRWGRFVRKTSLDELLNFVSVVKGDMSIIGPRPLLDYYTERLNDRHKKIYAIRPGLECPTLHSQEKLLSWQERLDNYVWYVENCTFLIDIKLALRIIQTALHAKGTNQRANANHGGLLGYDKDGNIIYTKAVPEIFLDEFCKKHGYKNLEEAIEKRRIDK